MSTIAFDQFALTRIADFARSLSRLHQAARRYAVDDDQFDREFNAVCQSIWGYTIDDISDDLFSAEDHLSSTRWTKRMRASSRPSRVTTSSTSRAC